MRASSVLYAGCWMPSLRSSPPPDRRLRVCRARVDNLYFAVALGDIDAVRGYLDGHSGPRDYVPPRKLPADRPRLRPELMIEYALIWAVAHDRREVVE